MRETILLFHFTDKDRRNKIARALLPLNLKIRDVEKKDYLKPIGYLAGNKEIAVTEQEYGGEELEGEMLIMAGLTDARLDAVLKALKRSGAGQIPYKAVLTNANQHWKAPELFAELKKEHEQMQQESPAEAYRSKI